VDRDALNTIHDGLKAKVRISRIVSAHFVGS
jgi:hypothetical protein